MIFCFCVVLYVLWVVEYICVCGCCIVVLGMVIVFFFVFDVENVGVRVKGNVF